MVDDEKKDNILPATSITGTKLDFGDPDAAETTQDWGLLDETDEYYAELAPFVNSNNNNNTNDRV